MCITQAICSHTAYNNRRLPRTRYTRERLHAFRRSAASKKPSSTVLNNLALHGILQFRGCRGGTRIQRAITVVSRAVNRTTNRLATMTNSRALNAPAINKHLIPVANIQSERHYAHEQFVNFGLHNIRSLHNKVSDVLELISEHKIGTL